MNHQEMQKYRNISGNSTVKAFTAEQASITIEFTNGEVYEYSYSSAGKHHVETMKLLAKAGYGLGSYIEEVVEMGWSRQLV
ncbi:MAG: hypothetical protein RL266_2163 [Bacteroidota bacterium]|jgi:hypothetical protein